MLEEKPEISSSFKFEKYAKTTNKIAIIMVIMALLLNPIIFDVRIGNLSGWFTMLFFTIGALSFRIPYPYKRILMNKIGLLITGLYGVFLVVSFTLHFVQLDTVLTRRLARQIDHSVEVRVNLHESRVYDEYFATVYLYMNETAFWESELPNQADVIRQTVSFVLNEHDIELWILNIRFGSGRPRRNSWNSSNSFTTCSYRWDFMCSSKYSKFTVRGNILKYISDVEVWENTTQWTLEELEWLIAENLNLTSIINEVRRQTVYTNDYYSWDRHAIAPRLDRESRASNFFIPLNEAVNHDNFEAVSQHVLSLVEDANRNGADIQSITVVATGVFDIFDTSYRLIYTLDVESGMGQLDVDVNPGEGWLLFEDVSFGDIEETILSVDDALEELEERIINKLGVYSVNAERIRYHRQPHQYGVFTQPRLSVEVVISPEIGVEGFADFVAFAQPLLIDEVSRFHRTPNNNPWEVFLILEDQLVWRIYRPSWSSPRRDRGSLLNLVAGFEVTGITIVDIQETLDEWFYDGE